MQQPDRAAVLATRIWLSQNIGQALTRSQFRNVTGTALLLYLEGMPGFPAFSKPGSSSVERTARELRDFMASNRELVEAYERGKAARNPSGRTCRIHRRGGPAKFD